MLALDDISVDLVPLVGEQYVREEEEEEEDISTEEEGRNSTPPTKKTTFVNEVNGTEMQPTPSEGENLTTEKAEGGSTVDAGIGIGEGGEGGESTEVSLAPTSGPTRPSPACANNSSNCTEAELMAEQKQDTSVYGYTGEVFLFIFTLERFFLFLHWRGFFYFFYTGEFFFFLFFYTGEFFYFFTLEFFSFYYFTLERFFYFFYTFTDCPLSAFSVIKLSLEVFSLRFPTRLCSSASPSSSS